VARTWLAIRVDLLGGRGQALDPAPGRIFLVGPSHSFEQFAEAIDAAFARWDLSHLHEFELSDGRRVGYLDDEFAPELVWLDHAKLKVAKEVKPGEAFTYVFDLGDNWEHRCAVEAEKVDPLETYGLIPPMPVAFWGWGSIPDQYGRRSFEGQGEDYEDE
jgi:Plasmid pRiA4b ORF-3-like protein